jgi:hypothetical protein
MKNRIGMFVIVAALVAPQAALWADATAGGTSAPGTPSSTTADTSKPKHKGHKHHKKMKKDQTSNTSTSGAPASTPAN